MQGWAGPAFETVSWAEKCANKRLRKLHLHTRANDWPLRVGPTQSEKITHLALGKGQK